MSVAATLVGGCVIALHADRFSVFADRVTVVLSLSGVIAAVKETLRKNLGRRRFVADGIFDIGIDLERAIIISDRLRIIPLVVPSRAATIVGVFVIPPQADRLVVIGDSAHNAAKAENYGHAISNYTDAVRLKPAYAAAYKHRGDAYYSAGDYDSAIADYDQAIRLRRDYEDAYNRRGLAWHHKGDYAQAVRDYDCALQINPDVEYAVRNKALAKEKLAQGFFDSGDNAAKAENYGHAISKYTEAIRVKSDYAAAYKRRGDAHYSTYDYDSAIADYDQAIRLRPNYEDAYNRRGLAWFFKGDYAQAVRDYDRALQINPDVEYAVRNKALAKEKLAQTKKRGWF